MADKMNAYLTVNNESQETQNYADKINSISERKIAWLLAAVKAFLLFFFYFQKKKMPGLLKRSGLQTEVIHFYRKCFRAAREKPIVGHKKK